MWKDGTDFILETLMGMLVFRLNCGVNKCRCTCPFQKPVPYTNYWLCLYVFHKLRMRLTVDFKT